MLPINLFAAIFKYPGKVKFCRFSERFFMPKMPSIIKLFFILILLAGAAPTVFAQTQKNEPKTPNTDSAAENVEDDVLKISSELIQTGVAVTDKKGVFVNNLKREDFELLVDGKPVSIQFFEPNTLAADAGKIPFQPEKTPGKFANANQKPVKTLGGKTVVFAVDDLHLSADSHYRVRKLISKFIEREMSAEDTVAVVSTTGKIGFLQQFTNDKTVLQAAVARLIYDKDRRATDRSTPPMTEYEALLISQFDKEITDIFVAQEIGDEESKREVVRSRARGVMLQAAAINRGTYSTLEQTIRSAAQMPGRKIVFFISDGFLLDPTNTDSTYLMRRITDAATRTNTVIYSFDAKGLEAGFPEGTASLSPNGGFRVQSGERFDLQDGLDSLADETGGRFIKDTNDLQTGLTRSIAEASQYYLLAWEPVSESGRAERLRKIEISVRNRPDLKIRAQSGYLNEIAKSETEESSKNRNKSDKKNQPPLPIAEQQLNHAVSAQIPARQLPTALVVNHLDLANEGALLAAALQIEGDAVEFTVGGDKATASVDIVGFVYNSDGKREGYFRQLLNVDTAAAKLTESNRPNIYYNYQTKLKPGLYQMRVAARDVKSGRVGSAVQWITIPDLASRKLTLSSLILSGQLGSDGSGKKNSSENAVADLGELNLPVSVDRRFARSSVLRYVIFIYNAAQNTARPDVALQTQIFRGANLVVTSGTNPISVEGQDPARLPYAAEISLDKMLPGRYELQITVQDRKAKTEAVRRVGFEIE